MPAADDRRGAAKLKRVKSPKATKDTKGNADLGRAKKYEKTTAYHKTLRSVYDTAAVRNVRRKATVGSVGRNSDGTEVTGPHGHAAGMAHPDGPVTIDTGFQVKTKRDLKARQLLQAAASKSNTDAGNVLTKLHRDRMARAVELRQSRALHDVTTNEDLKAGDNALKTYTQTRDYQLKRSKQAFDDAQAKGKTLSQSATASTDALTKAKDKGHKIEVQQAALLPSNIAARKKSQALLTDISDNITRPLYAVTGGVDAAIHGKSIAKGIGGGASLKHKVLTGNILKDAGLPTWLAAPTGFIGDVLLDPTTYATLGTGIPAEIAAKTAMKAALKEGAAEVAAKTITQHELETRVLALGRKTWEEHPGKARGLTVGVQFRGKVAKTGPHGHSVLGAVLPGKKAVRTLGEHVVHDIRPQGMNAVAHEHVRDVARRYRAGREKGDRYADTMARTIQRAVDKAGLSLEDEHTIVHAIEAKNIDSLGVGTPSHAIASAIVTEMKRVGDAEIDKGLRATLLGETHAPKVPAVTADANATRQALTHAQQELRRQEKTLADSRRGAGVAHGRGQILSRNVSGTVAERAAQRVKAVFAGGGHGHAQAEAALKQSEANVAHARAGVETAQATHDAEKIAAREQKAIARAAQKEADRHARSASGYFPRYIDKEIFDPDAGTFTKTGGTDASLKRRKREGPIADMKPEEQATYDLRLATSVGNRLKSHGRLMNEADYNSEISKLGRVIDPEDPGILEDLKNWNQAHQLGEHPTDGRGIYIQTKTGIIKATDKYGQVNVPRLTKAHAAGLPILMVNKDELAHAEDLRLRGRNTVESSTGVGSGRLKGTSAGVARGFDRIQGKFKTGQTQINPGYHVTNLVGDTFNSMLAGTHISDLRHGIRVKHYEHAWDKRLENLDQETSAKIVQKAKDHVEQYGTNGHLSDAEVATLAEKHGVTKTGFAGHELNELNKPVGERTARGKLNPRKYVLPNKRPMTALRTFSEAREDMVRLATFRRALKRGLTPDEAANWVNKHHFDYGDLTASERTVLRRIIPFYTFMARNSRLQASSVLRRPGIYANTEAARQESGAAGGFDPDFAKTLRKFEQQGMPWGTPLKVGGYPLMVFPKLPSMDLNNFTPNAQGAFDNFTSRLSVLPKIALEQGFGFNSFTRSLEKNKDVPAPHWADALVHRLHLGALSPINDRVGGKQTPGWSWRIPELLRQIPASNLLSSVGTPSKYERPNDTALAAASYFGGLRGVQYDPKAVKLNQLNDQIAKKQADIADLKLHTPHRGGDKWKGKVKKENKALLKLEKNSAQVQKAMGVKDPSYKNLLHHAHPKIKVFK